jgi:hypothetical protein
LETWITKEGEKQIEAMAIVSAATHVDDFAQMDDGTIEIPTTERLQLEDRIEEFADVAAVAFMCESSVRSVAPYVAIRPQDEPSRKWLAQTKGIHLPMVGIPVRMNHGYTVEQIQKMCLDRRDGLALLAEAQSQSHPSGRLHEFMRLFENAFLTKASTTCTTLLPQFLQTTPYGFSKHEIGEWLQMRDSASHADGQRNHSHLSMNSHPFVRGSAVTPVINRVEIAAYDVLLNKKEWASSSLDRRSVFLADVHSDQPRSGGIVIYQGKTPSITISVVDAFGAYPLMLNRQWKRFPADWYVENDR